MDDTGMKTYYSERAVYYDRVYTIAERQRDLRLLESRVAETFDSKNVLEIACGTGYWTQFIAPVAKYLTATDISAEVIEIARRRESCGEVAFRIEDALALSPNIGRFDSLFSGLWVSHIPCQGLRGFIEHIHEFLITGSKVMLIDNSQRQCELLPVVYTDDQGNTYQDRVLDDGSVHRILKNFPDEAVLEEAIEDLGTHPQYEELDHYWWFSYDVK